MSSLFRLFEEFAINKNIIDQSFLVGGTVRDILSDKEIHDYDIVIRHNAVDIARTFADEISASYIVLDRASGIIRVAKDREFIDICAMKGESIEDDLLYRDFTINAMALNMGIFTTLSSSEKSLLTLHIIDPLNGINDLKSKLIRMVSEDNLVQDPLRLLRAYRFASTLDFSIHPDTCNAIRKNSSFISSVSVERIAEELRHILNVKFSSKTLIDMLNSALLIDIFPELQDISHEILHYAIQSCSCAEHILANIPIYFSNHQKHIEDYFIKSYRIICLKFTLLLLARNLSEKAAVRLKMSNKEIEFIKMIIKKHKNLGKLKDADRTKKIDFLIESGDDIYPLSVFDAAMEMTSKSSGHPLLLFCNEMLDIYHYEIIAKRKFLPIITGDDLIEKLHLKPSPLFRKLLQETERLFFHGDINSKEEALNAVRKMFKLEQ